ncbi:MAG TPA: ankyrin repeat domain-containing protein, partial [Aquirhabdus sp.]
RRADDESADDRVVKRSRDVCCAICLEDYPNTRKQAGLIFTQCNHGFHINCLHQLLAVTTRCPNCRREIDVAALVGPVQAQQFERARAALRHGANAIQIEELIQRILERNRGRTWHDHFAILATNPSIAARRAALVAAAGEDDGTSWLRAEFLESTAAFVRHLATLPNDVARQTVLIRPNAFGMSPLSIAVGNDEVEAVTSLLATLSDDSVRQAVVNSPVHRQTLLQKAAWHGNVAVARLLPDAGAQVNAADDEGLTPLHEAVISNNENMVQLLFERSADRALVDNQGRTAAMFARELRRDAIAQMIEQYQQTAGV